MIPKFFQKVISIVYAFQEEKYSTNELNSIANLLWQRKIFSMSGQVNAAEIGFYRVLSSLDKIIKEKPSSWLDFRAELSNLQYYFSEIQNTQLKQRLTMSKLQRNFKQKMENLFLEPYFANNFAAQKVRIEKRKQEVDKDSLDYEFLTKLQNWIEPETVGKKKESFDDLENLFSRVFSDVPTSEINEKLRGPASILDAYEYFAEPSKEKFLNQLVSACTTLQENRTYRSRNSTEDEYNQFVGTLLKEKGYGVSDQTQRSESPGGKGPGELDLYVEWNNDPFTIIEALKLNSVNKREIKSHLNKIFLYDARGLPENFILVYYITLIANLEIGIDQ